MSNTKISDLTALTGANAATTDVFPMVDVSDTTQGPGGSTKKMTRAEMFQNTPPIAVTGTLSASGITSVTDTTDATSTTAASLKTAGGLAVAKKMYIGDNIVVSKATDLVVSATTTGTANAATLELYSGNGTTSGRYAYGIYKSLETVPQQWSVGMIASKDYRINNITTVTAAVIINSSTNDITIAGNIVMASGKGIDFSATANGSGTTTSEVLDDYEEGTWTPTIVGASTAGAGTYTAQEGYYTKVGNLVTFNAYIAWTAHTGTGNTNFGGLPFTSKTITGLFPCTIAATNLTYGAGELTAMVQLNSTQGTLYLQTSGGGIGNVALDTAGGVWISGTYIV